MIDVLGRTLSDAERLLKERGIEQEIVRTAGFRETADGTWRVIRASEDGRRLTVARFPDTVRTEKDHIE